MRWWGDACQPSKWPCHHVAVGARRGVVAEVRVALRVAEGVASDPEREAERGGEDQGDGEWSHATARLHGRPRRLLMVSPSCPRSWSLAGRRTIAHCGRPFGGSRCGRAASRPSPPRGRRRTRSGCPPPWTTPFRARSGSRRDGSTGWAWAPPSPSTGTSWHPMQAFSFGRDGHEVGDAVGHDRRHAGPGLRGQRCLSRRGLVHDEPGRHRRLEDGPLLEAQVVRRDGDGLRGGAGDEEGGEAAERAGPHGFASATTCAL